MNATKEQYGELRLENCLNSIDHQCNLSNLLEGVSKSLAEHVQDAEQSDDITMLAVRFMNNGIKLSDTVVKAQRRNISAISLKKLAIFYRMNIMGYLL